MDKKIPPSPFLARRLFLPANDLHTKGSFSGGNLHTIMSADGAFQKRTTDLGDEFLQYITEPEALGDG